MEREEEAEATECEDTRALQHRILEAQWLDDSKLFALCTVRRVRAPLLRCLRTPPLGSGEQVT